MGVAGVAAGVGIAGTVAKTASGFMGAGAARDAASQQAAELQQGVDFQKQVYDTTQQMYAPYYGAGVNALGSVSQLYGLPPAAGSNVPQGNALDAYKAYTQTPFYTFPLQQGQQSLDQSAAARGLTLSGGQMAAQQQWGQDYASKNFQNYITGLSSLANLGTTAAGGVAQAGLGAAGNVLQGQGQIGQTRAAGTIGAQNQINNALSGVGPLAQSVGGLWGNGGPFGAPATGTRIGEGGVAPVPVDVSSYNVPASVS